MIDKKKAFENSFKGYHKDAPAYLHAKSKALHKAKDSKVYFGHEPSKSMIKREIEDKHYERKNK